MHEDIREILVSREQIEKRVKEMALQISVDYKGKCVFFIGVLKGCFLFLSDLAKNAAVDTNVDFMMLSSYSGTASTGVVRTMLDLKQSIEGKHVIIVEDIVDSGLTMNYMMKNLRTRNPESIEVCTLLNKPSCRKVEVPIKYCGFEIPDKFVVGYGLDYNELYRNLPYIGVLKPSAIRLEEKNECK
ncbi:MAG: hypoxanthine phosphoribosyltransferase [Elusimicrobia bacterium CG08_land_8_20_14_0_20_51_18]|nr:MAG: hypoxanthine phosphoribosyltransferase [Elusimicrobia bacterium CG08_land_8_20_14_0_20_51_18]